MTFVDYNSKLLCIYIVTINIRINLFLKSVALNTVKMLQMMLERCTASTLSMPIIARPPFLNSGLKFVIRTKLHHFSESEKSRRKVVC